MVVGVSQNLIAPHTIIRAVPDLNGKGLFLRGGSGSSVLKEEEAQMKDHHHKDSGHSHTCTGKNWPNVIIFLSQFL